MTTDHRIKTPVLQVHDLAISYEHGDWAAFSRRARELGLHEDEAPQCYREAVEWANAIASANAG